MNFESGSGEKRSGGGGRGWTCAGAGVDVDDASGEKRRNRDEMEGRRYNASDCSLRSAIPRPSHGSQLPRSHTDGTPSHLRYSPNSTTQC